MVEESVYPFPTVDVPDHAHYTIGAVILAVGITGMLGNFLVIYAFSRWEEQAEVKLNKYYENNVWHALLFIIKISQNVVGWIGA